MLCLHNCFTQSLLYIKCLRVYMDGWMGGWVDGWMGGWVDGWALDLQVTGYYIQQLWWQTIVIGTYH
jgi:hypothetical protein